MSARRVLQEKPQGEFATLWKTSLEEDTSLEQVELNAALADIMAAKDATEQVTATDFAALAREREARSRAKGPAPVPLQSGAAPPPVRPTAAQA